MSPSTMRNGAALGLLAASCFACSATVAKDGHDLGVPATSGGDLSTAPGGDLSSPPARDLSSAPAADLSSLPLPPDLSNTMPGPDRTITLFNGATFYFDGDPAKNHRENFATIDFPGDGLYKQITLHVDLSCPSGGCDPWDRAATIGLVDGTQTIELGRYMTPYGVKGAWDIDVTDLRPLFAGTRKVRGFIDTWIGTPQGWTLTATLVFVGGIPTNVPIAVALLPWGNFDVGDPGKPIASSLPPQSVSLAPGASHGAVRVIVTGHGQGNSENCAEFCAKNHTLTVDGATAQQQSVWRGDCAQNPINNQGGNWQPNRANWCPGADVKPWRIDVGAHAAPFMVGYAMDDYVNTCNGDTGKTCNLPSCVFGPSTCAYNDSDHTRPFYMFSALLISYR
jgi:hypothetical protein